MGVYPLRKSTLTARQKQVIHQAARKLGLDDGQYRLVLHNVVGRTSSTEMTQSDYDRLAAWFADQGVAISAASQPVEPGAITTRQRYRLKHLSIGWMQRMQAGHTLPSFDGVIAQAIGRQYRGCDDLARHEAARAIQAIDQVLSREAG